MTADPTMLVVVENEVELIIINDEKMIESKNLVNDEIHLKRL